MIFVVGTAYCIQETLAGPIGEYSGSGVSDPEYSEDYIQSVNSSTEAMAEEAGDSLRPSGFWLPSPGAAVCPDQSVLESFGSLLWKGKIYQFDMNEEFIEQLSNDKGCQGADGDINKMVDCYVTNNILAVEERLNEVMALPAEAGKKAIETSVSVGEKILQDKNLLTHIAGTAVVLSVAVSLTAGVRVVIYSCVYVISKTGLPGLVSTGIGKAVGVTSDVVSGCTGTVVSLAAKAVQPCIAGSSCSPACNKLASAVVKSINKPVDSSVSTTLELTMSDLPNSQFDAGVGRMVFMMIPESFEFGKKVVIPACIIPLQSIMVLHPENYLPSKRRYLQKLSATVAYLEIADSLSESSFSDESFYLMNSYLNGQFIQSQKTLPMSLALSLKFGCALLASKCTFAVNSLIPVVVASGPAGYYGYKGEPVPLLNIKPKFLMVGAMGVGDISAAVADGKLDYALLPLLIIGANSRFQGPGAAIGWIIALSYGPLNYYLGDMVKSLWYGDEEEQ